MYWCRPGGSAGSVRYCASSHRASPRTASWPLSRVCLLWRIWRWRFSGIHSLRCMRFCRRFGYLVRYEKTREQLSRTSVRWENWIIIKRRKRNGILRYNSETWHSRSKEPVRRQNERTTTTRDRGAATAIGAHPFEQLRTGRATRPMKKGIKSVKIVDALCNVMTTGCDRGSYHFISYHGTHSRTRPKMCCFFSLSPLSPRRALSLEINTYDNGPRAIVFFSLLSPSLLPAETKTMRSDFKIRCARVSLSRPAAEIDAIVVELPTHERYPTVGGRT